MKTHLLAFSLYKWSFQSLYLNKVLSCENDSRETYVVFLSVFYCEVFPGPVYWLPWASSAGDPALWIFLLPWRGPVRGHRDSQLPGAVRTFPEVRLENQSAALIQCFHRLRRIWPGQVWQVLYQGQEGEVQEQMLQGDWQLVGGPLHLLHIRLQGKVRHSVQIEAAGGGLWV